MTFSPDGYYGFEMDADALSHSHPTTVTSDDGTSALDQADQNRHHSQNQQDVNKPTKRVRADHAQQPQDQQQNSYSPEHWASLLNL
jgi:hypothetical protein